MANGEVIKTLSTDVTYYSVNTLSQDGKTLAFVSQLPEHECLVKIIDMEQGKSVAEIPFPTIVKSLKISPDGKTLAAGCFNRSVQVWDLAKILQK